MCVTQAYSCVWEVCIMSLVRIYILNIYMTWSKCVSNAYGKEKVWERERANDVNTFSTVNAVSFSLIVRTKWIKNPDGIKFSDKSKHTYCLVVAAAAAALKMLFFLLLSFNIIYLLQLLQTYAHAYPHLDVCSSPIIDARVYTLNYNTMYADVCMCIALDTHSKASHLSHSVRSCGEMMMVILLLLS